MLAGCAVIPPGVSKENLPGVFVNDDSGAVLTLDEDGRFHAEAVPGEYIDNSAVGGDVYAMEGSWSFFDEGGGTPFAILMIESGGPEWVGNLQLFFETSSRAYLDPDVDSSGKFLFAKS